MKLIKVNNHYQIILNKILVHKTKITQDIYLLEEDIEKLTFDYLYDLKGDLHDPVEIASFVENKLNINCELFHQIINDINYNNQNIVDFHNNQKTELINLNKREYARNILSLNNNNNNYYLPLTNNRKNRMFELHSHSITKQYLTNYFPRFDHLDYIHYSEDKTNLNTEFQILKISSDILNKCVHITERITILQDKKCKLVNKIKTINEILMHVNTDAINNIDLFLLNDFKNILFNPILDSISSDDFNSINDNFNLINKAFFGFVLASSYKYTCQDNEYIKSCFLTNVYKLFKNTELLFCENNIKPFHLDLIKELLLKNNLWKSINIEKSGLTNKTFISQIETIIKLGHF